MMTTGAAMENVGMTQSWIQEQVALAQEYGEPAFYSAIQAGRAPKVLIQRWKHLNSVLGAETVDTYLAAAVPGVIGFLVGCIGLGWAANATVGLYSWLIGAACGLGLGAVVSYARFIRMVYQETYIETVAYEYHSVIAESSDASDASVAFLPRLAFYLRPEALEGNRGETGFRDRGARISLRLGFGQSVGDLRCEADYYALSDDPSALIPAPSIEFYSLSTLVRKCGRFFRDFAVPTLKPDLQKTINTLFPHIILAGGMLSAVLILAM